MSSFRRSTLVDDARVEDWSRRGRVLHRSNSSDTNWSIWAGAYSECASSDALRDDHSEEAASTLAVSPSVHYVSFANPPAALRLTARLS